MTMKNALSLGTDSRKVAMFAPLFLIACVFLWFGKIVSAEWIELMKWTYTALAAALTAEHFAGKVVKEG